jgi:hypothetical protein
MEEIQGQVLRFRAEQRISRMMKFALDSLEEIYALQQNSLSKLGESLADIEESVYSETGKEIDLAHLAKHGEFLDETLLKLYRKKLLDYGGEMRREL